MGDPGTSRAGPFHPKVCSLTSSSRSVGTVTPQPFHDKECASPAPWLRIPWTEASLSLEYSHPSARLFSKFYVLEFV